MSTLWVSAGDPFGAPLGSESPPQLLADDIDVDFSNAGPNTFLTKAPGIAGQPFSFQVPPIPGVEDALGIVNIETYGIYGTNDWQAIQNAFNAAGTIANFPNGALVFFPGNLQPVITGPVDIPENPSLTESAYGIWIKGGGKMTSIVTVAAAGGSFTLGLSSGIAPTAGQTISLSFTMGTFAYTSPTYTVKAWDSLRTIADNLIALIHADPLYPGGPGATGGQWMNAITALTYYDTKHAYSTTTEVDFTVAPAYYGDAGSFSATIGGAGNLTVALTNSGAFALNAAVNFSPFRWPQNTGSFANAMGAGAQDIFIAFNGNGPNPGAPPGATAGAVFEIPYGSYTTIRDVRVTGNWKFLQKSAAPPFGSGTTQSRFTFISNVEHDGYGHAYHFKGNSGNFFIEKAFVHGNNSSDPYHQAFYVEDIPVTWSGGFAAIDFTLEGAQKTGESITLQFENIPGGPVTIAVAQTSLQPISTLATAIKNAILANGTLAALFKVTNPDSTDILITSLVAGGTPNLYTVVSSSSGGTTIDPLGPNELSGGGVASQPLGGVGMEQFRLGPGVDVEGYASGIWASLSSGGMADSDIGPHAILSDSGCMFGAFFQAKPYVGQGGSTANVKVGPVFASAGLDALRFDAGGNGLSPGVYSTVKNCKIWGPGGAFSGNATSNWSQPYGEIQLNLPQMQQPTGSPLNAPTLVPFGGIGTGGTLLAGNYKIAYAWTTANGASAISPIATITIGAPVANGVINVKPNDTAPLNATGIAVYASYVPSGTPGAVTLQNVGGPTGGALQGGALVAGAAPNTVDCSGNVFAAGVTVSAVITIVDSLNGTFTFSPTYTTVGGETAVQVMQYLANLCNANTNWATYFITAWAWDGILFFELLPSASLPVGSVVTGSYTATIGVPTYYAVGNQGGVTQPFVALYTSKAATLATNTFSISAATSGTNGNLASITTALLNNLGTTGATTTSTGLISGSSIVISGGASEISAQAISTKPGTGIGFHLLFGVDITATGVMGRDAENLQPGGIGIQIDQAYGVPIGGGSASPGGFFFTFDLRSIQTPVVDNFSQKLLPSLGLSSAVAPCSIRGCTPYVGRGYPIIQPPFPASGVPLINNGPYDWEMHITNATGVVFSDLLEYNAAGTFATEQFTVAGTPGGGTFQFVFSGTPLSVTVGSIAQGGGSATTAATNIATALNANTNFAKFYKATSSLNVVTITARLPGVAANAQNIAATSTGGATINPGGLMTGGGGSPGLSWLSVSGAEAFVQRYYTLPVGCAFVPVYASGSPTYIVNGI